MTVPAEIDCLVYLMCTFFIDDIDLEFFRCELRVFSSEPLAALPKAKGQSIRTRFCRDQTRQAGVQVSKRLRVSGNASHTLSLKNRIL